MAIAQWNTPEQLEHTLDTQSQRYEYHTESCWLCRHNKPCIQAKQIVAWIENLENRLYRSKK